MVTRTLLLSACMQVFFLSACSESSFSGSSSSGKKPSEKPDSPDKNVEPVESSVDTQTNGEEDPKDEVVSISDLDISKQEGRSVEACFSYNQQKMNDLIAKGQAAHGHYCNEAVFDVYFSGEIAGQINLNNRNGTGGNGHIGPTMSGPSVHGGTFTGKWIDGMFDVETRCALWTGCHEDVGFLSLIGEVVTASGKKKWLKIDQGLIYPGRHYSYKFAEFTLSDVKPTFGQFCELQ